MQGALVLVAWLIGLNRSRRTLLGVVYAITATVSIAFSYVSLYNWFSARERPAAVERKLYDELNNSLDKTQQLMAAASAEAQKHVLALGMARMDAEKVSGGEQQFCLALVGKKLAIMQDEDGKRFYLLDQAIHELLLECLATRGLPLRASATSGTT